MLLRFVGTDGSMGLRTGQVYQVDIRVWGAVGIRIISPVVCPYSSQQSFWRNWEKP